MIIVTGAAGFIGSNLVRGLNHHAVEGAGRGEGMSHGSKVRTSLLRARLAALENDSKRERMYL
ncbi:NAD dependent epimerase/dehydratase domain protein, partial [Bordetella hinzii CA90 BAL1384]|uniref:NAD-dependent epimerase/dehydratase family protein n=1 Tax=Bordetella hinzii TaxID=103855 RepID=UPI000459B9C8